MTVGVRMFCRGHLKLGWGCIWLINYAYAQADDAALALLSTQQPLLKSECPQLHFPSLLKSS